MIELYAHNKIAYSAVCEMLARHGKAAVVHPTGTGKSFIGFKLCEEQPEKRIAWLSPSEHIWHTQLENVHRSGFKPQNVTFYTYAKLMQMTEQERKALKPDVIILDEFHRCGAGEWGKGVSALLKENPGAQLLGLTATPVRYLDGQRNMVDELFDGCVAHSMTLTEAIVQGILPAPKYILAMYAFDKELEKYKRRARKVGGAAERTAEHYIEQLRRNLDQAASVASVFQRHMPNLCGKYLFFCSDYAHLKKMRACAKEWFSGVDTQPHLYEVYAEDGGATNTLRKFKEDDSHHLRILYCIDMLNEGVHVDDLDGVILGRTTISPIVYKQQIGRALSVSGKKTPVIFDLVNNVENLYSISIMRQEMAEMVHWYANTHEESLIVHGSFELIDEVRDCRELFALLEDTLSEPWEMMYEEAKAYFQKHGNLNVAKRFYTDDGVALGNWIQTQRRVRQGTCNGLLTPERIAKLDAIGMIWRTKQELSWENGYMHAKCYRESQGDLNVPFQYTCPDGFPLGKWISNKRAIYAGTVQRQSLRDEQIAQLNQLGMVWSYMDYSFERGCSSAMRYAIEHGNLLVPTDYVDPDGFKLGRWIAYQKTKQATLSEKQKEKLNALGMNWEKKQTLQWEHAFCLAQKYQKKHGNLDIPISYEEDGVRLGRWMERQRRKYVERKLEPERESRLLELGMSVREKNAWDLHYQEAVEYFSRNGTLDISPRHATQQELSLYSWLRMQRQAYAQGRLTPSQVKALESLDIQWEKATDSNWKKRFAELTACYDSALGKPVTSQKVLIEWYKRQKDMMQQGKLRPWQQELWKTLPTASDSWEHCYMQAYRFFQLHGSLKGVTGSLAQWLQEQRRLYLEPGKNQLTQEQIQRLENIGMVWQNANERRWQAGYQAAQQYFSSHGGLNIKVGYVTEQGYPLGSWLYEQKRRYKAGRLEIKRQQALKAFNVPWLMNQNTKA